MNSYQVEGDLTASKSSETHPLKTLCDECVTKYNVIVDEGSDSSGPCEDCGQMDKETGAGVFCVSCDEEFTEEPIEGDECPKCGKKWTEEE